MASATGPRHSRPSQQWNPLMGYFHFPPAWIGRSLTPDEIFKANSFLLDVANIRKLQSGPEITCYRGGFFLFDFKDWPQGAPVALPGYEIAAGERVPRERTAAEAKMQDHLYNCLTVMNAHQACLNSSLSIYQGHAVAI